MRKNKIFKKIIITLCALLFGTLALFILHAVCREVCSRYGRDEVGRLVIFDTCVAAHTAEIDRKMARDGYAVGDKTVYFEDVMPYSGVNMRILKIENEYAKAVDVTSHGKTPYQRMIKGLESRLGRLPWLFYALDIVKYEGERREVCEEAVVECRFMLIEDKKDRIFGGDHYAYSGTMERRDSVNFTFFDGDDRLLGEYSEGNARAGKHFSGDLSWLKAKAYNNYVSPIAVMDAFEWYE